MDNAHPSKLTLFDERVQVPCREAEDTLGAILLRNGCPQEVAQMVAEHLVEADMSGVESHGVMRILQYIEQYQSGYMDVRGRPAIIERDGFTEVDGGGGIGIPAMHLAVAHSLSAVEKQGIFALPIRNLGHTGRLGAYTEAAADAGCLMLLVGGGGRHQWRQVAPHGGHQAMLPTNPWSMGIPGGERGPVVLDFATGMIAGGWLYAARAAGGLVPDGTLLDKEGRPSRDPTAYFDGGAILPKGGPLGYGLAVMAEMIGEAMLGPVTIEANWLMITVETTRYREQAMFRAVAEEVLSELRNSPPADGFSRVQIPGEKEREQHSSGGNCIAVPARTWRQILALAARNFQPTSDA